VTTDVQLYEFPDDGAQIRVTVVDGEPWFYAADVCRVLGLTHVTNALARVDEADCNSTTVRSSGQVRHVKIVNESGLYDLILSSRKPEARKFRRWVTRDVLPTIRRTGGYGNTPALPQSYAEALRELASTVEDRDRARLELAEAAPKVEGFDALMASDGTMSIGAAAKALGGVGQNRLFELLRDYRILMDGESRRDDHNVPYQKFVDAGLFIVRTKPWRDSRTGSLHMRHKTLVTPKGLEFLRQFLARIPE